MFFYTQKSNESENNDENNKTKFEIDGKPSIAANFAFLEHFSNLLSGASKNDLDDGGKQLNIIYIM